MPIDLEMLVSASPPLYAYSAFVDSQYTRFTSDGYCRAHDCDRGFPIHNNNFLNDHRLSSNLPYSEINNSFNHGKSFRCANQELVDSHDENISCGYIQHDNKLREKKKVSFADDKGLALVEVRSIPNSPHAPPKWTHDLFSFITGDIKHKDVYINEKRWKVAFHCPPHDPSALAEKLESNLVALESAVVEENGANDVLKGTICVKNTTYVKEVLLRITFDRWISFEDVHCTFNESKVQEMDSQQSSTSDFDSFTFEITIPQSASRYEVVEFCICYRAEGKEHWDNNGGINYRLVSAPVTKVSADTKQLSPNKQHISPKFSPITEHFTSCPGIDAWETLLNEHTYW